MRYYSIAISDPKSGQVIAPPGFTSDMLGGATYTSFVNGQTLPAAWDVALDLPVIDQATSQGFGTVTVFGVSIQEIMQANDLNGKNITIAGGMQAGLPLANPSQAGPLVSGVINQAFGNWEGTNMSLDLVVAPGPAMPSSNNNMGGPGSIKNPKNLTLNWQGGQQLGQALKSCIETGFPGYTCNVNISSNLVRPAQDNIAGIFPTLGNLAEMIRSMSTSIVKTSGYAGVSIVMNGSTIEVFDGTASQGDTINIAFQDLVGQPTWIQSPNITAKVVMRSQGLKVGQKIMLPPTVVTNTADANSNIINQRATFQGGFTIVSLRHVGRYRNTAGDAWVTVIEGVPNNPVTNTQ